MQSNQLITDHQHPNYDLHMPRWISDPLPVSAIGVFSGVLVFFLLSKSQTPISVYLSVVPILAGGIYLGTHIFLKRITDLDRRLESREKFLDEIPLNGHETLLDVGCGNGILIISAAKRLPSCRAIGIDLWTEGAGDNSSDIFKENAKIEGVADRVSLQNEDVRHLPFENEAFDVNISGLTMHHLKAEVNKAIREMTRVLKTGGWMAIYDEPSTIMYCSKLMGDNGLQIKKKSVDMIFGIKT
jgi:hypothetical protein